VRELLSRRAAGRHGRDEALPSRLLDKVLEQPDPHDALAGLPRRAVLPKLDCLDRLPTRRHIPRAQVGQVELVVARDAPVAIGTENLVESIEIARAANALDDARLVANGSDAAAVRPQEAIAIALARARHHDVEGFLVHVVAGCDPLDILEAQVRRTIEVDVVARRRVHLWPAWKSVHRVEHRVDLLQRRRALQLGRDELRVVLTRHVHARVGHELPTWSGRMRVACRNHRLPSGRLQPLRRGLLRLGEADLVLEPDGAVGDSRRRDHVVSASARVCVALEIAAS